MRLLYELLIKWLPKNIKSKLGQSKFLKPLRSKLLYTNGLAKITSVSISKTYQNYPVNFEYYASIKDASKAKIRGVENTIIKHAIHLLKAYKKGDNDYVVFDVGSNFGYLTLVWALSIARNGTVHAFEANSHVLNALTKSVQKNQLYNVILNYVAVGAVDQIVDMHISNNSSNFNANDVSIKTVKLNMITLNKYCRDNQIERCDLIKIDVDGIELEILEGSTELIKKFKPIYVVETNNDARIIDFFIRNNYTILDMQLNNLGKVDKIPSNIFCVPL